jgi:hypothetical protein
MYMGPRTLSPAATKRRGRMVGSLGFRLSASMFSACRAQQNVPETFEHQGDI